MPLNALLQKMPDSCKTNKDKDDLSRTYYTPKVHDTALTPQSARNSSANQQLRPPPAQHITQSANLSHESSAHDRACYRVSKTRVHTHPTHTQRQDYDWPRAWCDPFWN